MLSRYLVIKQNIGYRLYWYAWPKYQYEDETMHGEIDSEDDMVVIINRFAELGWRLITVDRRAFEVSYWLEQLTDA